MKASWAVPVIASILILGLISSQEAFAQTPHVNAQKMTSTDVVNKLKTLSEGKLGAAVAKKMATTFLALVKHADFTTNSSVAKETESENEKIDIKSDDTKARSQYKGSPFGGDLVYNIQIILPESRDPAVYDAIFKSICARCYPINL